MEPTQDLLTDVEDGVLTLTLNRPDARNALSLPMVDALAAALDDGLARDDVGAIVLTGAPGAFCAGGDLATLSRGESIFGSMDEPERRISRQSAAQRDTVVRLWESPKPTIALVNGPAVGAGLGLALSCDLRIAARSAVLRTGFVRVGLAGDFGTGWLLTHLVGPSRARELLYLSDATSAERAAELGLVNEVTDDADLAERGARIARRLAAGPRLAMAAIKATTTQALHDDLATSADREARRHVGLIATEDHREAVRAMLRK